LLHILIISLKAMQTMQIVYAHAKTSK